MTLGARKGHGLWAQLVPAAGAGRGHCCRWRRRRAPTRPADRRSWRARADPYRRAPISFAPSALPISIWAHSRRPILSRRARPPAGPNLALDGRQLANLGAFILDEPNVHYKAPIRRGLAVCGAQGPRAARSEEPRGRVAAPSVGSGRWRAAARPARGRPGGPRAARALARPEFTLGPGRRRACLLCAAGRDARPDFIICFGRRARWRPI